MIRIVLDAMGGDHAPEEIVRGAVLAYQEKPEVFYTLVGDENRIRQLAQQWGLPTNHFQVAHTRQVIQMTEVPGIALKEKSDASINIAARLVAQGHGQALVSAGNTGATILATSRFIPRMPGIERAALAAVFPAAKNSPEDPGKTLMLDVGATLHCTTSQLVGFAIMGSHYAREVLNITQPRVALLNIGEEDSKGHSILVDTYAQLKKRTDIHFVGNVEGRDVMRGIADVIVTEGYVGNIVLKALEGLAELAFEMGQKAWNKSVLAKAGLVLLAPFLRKIKKRLDYTEYGGAPILGFEKLVIKAHGRSNAKAIKNAILLACQSIEHKMIALIQRSLESYDYALAGNPTH